MTREGPFAALWQAIQDWGIQGWGIQGWGGDAPVDKAVYDKVFQKSEKRRIALHQTLRALRREKARTQHLQQERDELKRLLDHHAPVPYAAWVLGKRPAPCISTHGGTGYAPGSYRQGTWVICGACHLRVPYVEGRGL